jgi:hypothetical protein
MERLKITRALTGLLLAALACGLSGCTNPFAPTLSGSTSSLWTNAQTVGGLLENFSTSYELRDSLRYAELLDESFQFTYYDPTLQRSDGWYRETDLQTTARIFRSFEHISLIWGGLSPEREAISTPDSLVEIRIQYQLVLDELSPLIGFARFTLFKPAGDRFRIVVWQDEF